MALRLMPRSPRRRIRLVTVIGGLRFCASGWARNTSADLTPATGARTTRFCRTIQRPSSAAPVVRSRVLELALRSRLRADAAASTASHPNVYDDPDTPLVGDETARFLQVIWGKWEEEYFLGRGWTRFTDLPVGQKSQDGYHWRYPFCGSYSPHEPLGRAQRNPSTPL